MTDLYDEDYDEPDGGYEADPDDYDDRLMPPEPDPEDWEIAKAYEEHYEHMEKVHGGHQCDCRPSRIERLWWRLRAAAGWFPGTYYRARNAARRPWTIRLLGAELTVRLRPRDCGACGGKGWAYSLDRSRPDDRPPGYNGVSLCGCGSAITRLADSRRYLRRTRNDLPF